MRGSVQDKVRSGRRKGMDMIGIRCGKIRDKDRVDEGYQGSVEFHATV